MKNFGGKIFIVIAFLVISLLAANAFIINSDIKGGFEPRIAKSILNYAENDNSFAFKNGKELNADRRTNAEKEQEGADENSHADAENDVENEAKEPGDPERAAFYKGKNEVDNGNGAVKKSVCANTELSLQASKQNGSGKVLMEQSSRRVLYGVNEHARCYPASTTKVLTAYVVLKNLPLDHIVTVPRQAVGVEGSSIYLKEGDQTTVEDLLFGLMLRSGNDAATALAIETAGSLQAFAALMNETALSLGARESHFVNPHGLHDDEHYTTAYDLALITAAAYELDDFKRIVGTTLRRIEVGGEVTAIANKNKFLKQYEGANGVKTGYTKKSGRCLVSGAKRKNMQLIGVVLNCPDMWNESMAMMDHGFENFDMVPLDSALLTYGKGKKRVEISAPYSVTEDWHDIYYPLAKDEYLVVNAL